MRDTGNALKAGGRARLACPFLPPPAPYQLPTCLAAVLAAAALVTTTCVGQTHTYISVSHWAPLTLFFTCPYLFMFGGGTGFLIPKFLGASYVFIRPLSLPQHL